VAQPTIRGSLSALLIVVSFAIACSRSRDIDPDLQREASAVFHAVDGLRQASNADKSVQLAGLSGLPCSSVEVCGLKNRCVAAYQGFVNALRDIARIEAALVDNTTLSAADLAAAQHALDTAREKTLACANEQGELARRMGR
jgi:hypothetical protein